MNSGRTLLLCCFLMMTIGWKGHAQGAPLEPISHQSQVPQPEEWPFIPLFSQFDLTLEPGTRFEAPLPFYYEEQSDTRKIWAVPPILSYTKDPGVSLVEFDFLYPVMTYDRYGDQYRWQFFQLLSIAGGPTQTENVRNRFTLYPIFFKQWSSDSNENYTAYGPFYGHLKNRLMHDEISYIMFPFYSETRKKDVVTDNYLYPLFHLRHGNELQGWQFWPLAGHEEKGLTYSTNGFGDVQRIPAYKNWFALWPFVFSQKDDWGTPRAQWTYGVLPAYVVTRSAQRDSTTVLWPFFSRIDDREKKYREWDVPWLFIVFARGEGKTMNRIFPFYSHAHTEFLESDYYLWPLFKYSRVHSTGLDATRSRILFYLYSDAIEKNTETGKFRRRMDQWPLFTYRRDFNGNKRLQVLAPLEPFLPGAHKIDRDYSPVWSLWLSQHNAKTGAESQSLFWNLYRHEKSPGAKKTSLLFGLFQYQSDSAGKRVRLFYMPRDKSKVRGEAAGMNPAAKAEK
jgi:hypothetical protein